MDEPIIPLQTILKLKVKVNKRAKEIERLVDLNKVKGALIKAQAKKIGVLLKEKEWLKHQILLYQEFHPGLPHDEKMELLEVDMQQALKDEE